MWTYNPELSDWNNTIDLMTAVGFQPEKTSIPIFVANILLHYEGLLEEDESLSIKDYLERGIRDREEGALSDFDYY